MQTKPLYITNRELLAEIHKSKKSFCYFIEERYADYDAIAPSVDSITTEYAENILAEKNAKKRRDPKEPIKTSIDELVFRVMTHEHVPLCDDKKRRSRTAAGQGHLRTNFPPFKHYVLREGEIVEVGRSHWRDGLSNGEFSSEHGKVSRRLAEMWMLLVDRYSRRGNWRGYSYSDEMRSTALLQLSQVGLVFDESKGDNPFAFYTTTIKNCFTRVLNVERKNQNIRDDILTMAGARPSHTRQIENELAHKFADQGTAKPAAAKRGRKAKVVTVIPSEDSSD
jgi:hypothetical protein